jgi:type I restriction-modification system DNA methylase subunit
MEILFAKEKISEELGISTATVNNWIKTRVIPSPDVKNHYSPASFKKIVRMIRNNQTRLNSRANRTLQDKKTVCYLGIKNNDRKKLLCELVNCFENSDLSVYDGILSAFFAILRFNNLIDSKWKANKGSRLDALLSEWIKKSSNPNVVQKFFAKYDIPNLNDDLLGAFYQSIQSISQKSSYGSYYTPSELLKNIKIRSNKTILDPCCGSGGILLNVLKKSHDTAKIFARDIDETALKICFINLVLFFNDKNISSDITKQDLILDANNDKFDYIVTNPPWGSKFNVKQKENLYRLYPQLSTSETFSICLYNASKMLKRDGELYFFLPHSFLNVAAHKNIRHYVLNAKNRVSVKLLGNAFKGVVSESILLHLKNNSCEKNINIQNKNGNVYKISVKNIKAPDYIVSADSGTYDNQIINKIYNAGHVTLNDENAIFALGIVTGNNKKYLSAKKKANFEEVYRGKDFERYKLLKPQRFLQFKPELYQQTAPVKYYRQPKIIYRFIGDRLVCVLDKKKAYIKQRKSFYFEKLSHGNNSRVI